MHGIMGGKGWILVALAMTVLCARSSQAPDCTSQIMQMQPCLPYVEGNTSMPGNACCAGLSSVYKNSPVCLCELISSPGGLSTPGINITNAVLLPTFCKVPTDTSQCTAMLSGQPSGTSSSPKTSSGSGTGVGSTPNNYAAANLFPSYMVVFVSVLSFELVLNLHH